MNGKSIEIKRGDTFFVVCTYTDAKNIPIALDSVDIKSQVRDAKNAVVSELIVNKLDQQADSTKGKFSLKSDTDTWAIGELKWDIQYTSDGNVSSSDTIKIVVIQDITK